MTLKFARSLAEMRAVLMDPQARGPDPVYQVFTNLDINWVNKTEIISGLYGREYPKTLGHYHLDNFSETYHVDSGAGMVILQDEKNVFLKKVRAGEEIIIPANFGHCWINIGKVPLVLYDNHQNPQADYEKIKNNHGMAYYLIEENGQPKPVPNPHYQNPPPVVMLERTK